MTSMAPTVALPLLLGLPEVAELARVRRPVVSMWRRRLADTEHPFPAPRATGRSGIELFDAAEVAAWLVGTAHGNNPDALAEAPRLARLDAFGAGVDGLTALLALRAVAGPLDAMDYDALLDVADEADPDDESLYTEVDALGPAAVSLAAALESVVGASYGVAEVFERALAAFTRDTTTLAPAGAALVSELAVELALTASGDVGSPRFAGATRAAADRLVDVARRLDESAAATVLVPGPADAATRMLRRRLAVHGIARGTVAVDEHGEVVGGVHAGAVVQIAQLPDGPEQDAVAQLEEIDRIAVNLDENGSAIVLAPTAVLVGALRGREAQRVRDGLLRTGRVRCIAVLPAGLVPARPRQRLALWVLGAAHASVPAEHRWTLVADLTGVELTESVRADLVTDLAASMGDAHAARSHPYGHGGVIPTSALLARTGELLGDRQRIRHAPAAVSERERAATDLPARLDGLRAAAGPDAPDALARLEPATRGIRLPAESLGRLIAERHVRVIPGVRLDAGELGDGDGFRVYDAGLDADSRSVDRLAFAARHPGASLTEPGDVVFVTGPRPAAVVDRTGSAVVAYPARVLRISRSDPAGLHPDVVAADIRRQPADAREWRRWRVRRMPKAQHPGLDEVLASTRRTRAELAARLARLDELDDLVIAGLAGGTVVFDPA